MTNEKEHSERSDICKKNKVKKKSKSEKIVLDQENRVFYNGYEAARRKRFNESIELLRLELGLDACPKVKTVENATDYIKQCKLLQQSIFHDDTEEDAQFSEDNESKFDDSNSQCDIISKLRKKLYIYKHLLKEANVTVDIRKQSNQICATFPVLTSSIDNVILKKEKKIYDIFKNVLENEISENIVSKNVSTQCEAVAPIDVDTQCEKFFYILGSNEGSLQSPTANTNDSNMLGSDNSIKLGNTSNIEGISEACLPTGPFIVGDIKNGVITLVTQSPSQGPIMSTGRNGTLVKGVRPNSLILLPNNMSHNSAASTQAIISPCKKLKKIAPKPQALDKLGIDASKEKVIAEPTVRGDSGKRKNSCKDKEICKLAKLSDAFSGHNCPSDKSTFDPDGKLQEISPPTLNALVRNAIISEVGEDDQALVNIMDFSCITNEERDTDCENTLDTDENLVDMLCSISDSKIIETPSKHSNCPQDATNDKTSLDIHKSKADTETAVENNDGKSGKDNQETFESVVLEPPIGKSNYSVMSLCMPSKVGKTSLPIMPQTETSIETVSVEQCNRLKDGNMTIQNEPLISPTKDVSTSFAGSVTKSSSDIEPTTSSLSLGNISHTYLHPFPNISIPPIGMPTLTKSPFMSNAVSHSISRISAPTSGIVTNTSEITSKVMPAFAKSKSNDSEVYNARTLGSTLTQTTPTAPLSAAAGTCTSTAATCINNSIFSLSTMPSYSRPFGFHPLSITEAPTTFSFTLTTQSAGVKSSVAISLPYSSESVHAISRTSDEKVENTKPPLAAMSNIQLAPAVGKSPAEPSTLTKVAFAHREAISESESIFKPIKQTMTVESSTDSFIPPMFRTPLKSDVVTSTPQIICWPLTSCGIQYSSAPSDLQLSHSSTYSSCSLSSVSSVFSSPLLSASTASIVLSEEKSSVSESIASNKGEKLTTTKKKPDVLMEARPIDKPVPTEENIDCIRHAVKELDASDEFRMPPHLPLSQSRCRPKQSSDSVENESKLQDKLPITAPVLDDISKSCSKDIPKGSVSETNSNALITGNDLSERCSREHINSKLTVTSETEPSCSSPEKGKSIIDQTLVKCRQDIDARNKNEIEQTTKPTELPGGKSILEILCHTGGNKIQTDHLNSNVNESTVCTNEKSSGNRYLAEAKNVQQSETTEDREFVMADVPPSDTCRLLVQTAKPAGNSMSLGSNIPTVSSQIASEQSTFESDSLFKGSTDGITYRKSLTCPAAEISFSASKESFEIDTSFLTDTHDTADVKMEDVKSQSKAATAQDKEKKIDRFESYPAKKIHEAKSFAALVSSDPIDGTRSNVPLKLCQQSSHIDVSHGQSTHQLFPPVDNVRNSEVIPNVTKTQTDVHMAPFSNACTSLPVQNINSLAIPVNKTQQVPDQLVMCGSQSVKKMNLSSTNSHVNQFEQQTLNGHSLTHNQSQSQQNVPTLAQQQSALLQNNQPTDIIGPYPGTERESIKGAGSANNMSTMMSGYSNVQTFDYNSYYRKPANFTRLDTRYNYHGYKQLPPSNNDFLADSLPLPNQPPGFEGNDELAARVGLEIASGDHLRGFSVSHLVSQSSDFRKSLQKEHTACENKTKDSPKAKSTAGKKSDGKGRGVPVAAKNASLGNEARTARGQARVGGNFPFCVNNKCQQKDIPNYSTEAILSSQNCIRQNHRQPPISQNYHFMSPNQMYQPSYSQPVKNLSQNAPFSYSNHDRSAPPMHCNTDYNFQLHPQASATLAPYGSNMPYMAPSYPYQNIAPASSAMIPSDIMGAHHAGTYRLPDISDQSNFHSNGGPFALPGDSQELYSGNVIGSSTQSTMTRGMPAAADPTFGIPGAAAMSYRNSVAKNTGNQNQSGGPSKRSKYFDPGMIASGVTTPTNFLDGGSLTHIPIHSFTPPCEDPSTLVHANLLGGPARHQNNFLLGHDTAMPLNGGHYQDVNVNLAANQHLQMPPVSKAGGGHVSQIFSSASTVRPDRQLNNSVAQFHSSSTVPNFNLTSIIPDIDTKHDGSSSTMGSGSSRQLSVMSSDPISMASYNRLSNMGTNFPSVSNNMKENGPQLDANNRFMPVNSVNNIFTHSHQVGLNLNSGLSAPTSTFSGMNFHPGDT